MRLKHAIQTQRRSHCTLAKRMTSILRHVAEEFPPFDLPLLANYLSRVYAQNDLGTAGSVTQPQLHGTPFPKIYMIAQSLC